MADKNAVLLHSSSAVAAMAPGHRLAMHDAIMPSDLIDERALLPGRNSPLRPALDRAFSSQDHQPTSTMETPITISRPFEPRIEVSYFAIRPAGAQRIAVLDEVIRRLQDLMCQSDIA